MVTTPTYVLLVFLASGPQASTITPITAYNTQAQCAEAVKRSNVGDMGGAKPACFTMAQLAHNCGPGSGALIEPLVLDTPVLSGYGVPVVYSCIIPKKK